MKNAIIVAVLTFALTGCVSLGPSSGKSPSQLAAERQARVAAARTWEPSPAIAAALDITQKEAAKEAFESVNPGYTVAGPY